MKQTNNKPSFRMPTGLKVVLMSLIMALVAKGLIAEERIGTVIAKARNDIFKTIQVFVDTTGNGAPDHIVGYPTDLIQAPWASLMDSMLEKGANVSFDDRYAIPFSGFPMVSFSDLTTINGMDVRMWFPGGAHWFEHAEEAANRRAASQQNAGR
jgi:hypothetical protein